jgi:hypothetical protein
MSNELTLAVADGASLSNEIDVSGRDKLIGLFFEAGYNTTNCTFAGFDNDGNEYSINDLTGAELELTISQTVSGFYPLDPAIFAGLNTIKLRRGTQASPFTTGAENTRIIAVRREY